LHSTVRTAREPNGALSPAHPRRFARGAALTCALIASLAWTGCRQAPHDGPTREARTIRLIEPRGSRSTATLPRAQIGGESRYVLAAHPVTVLRAGEAITLPDGPALMVPVELPPALAGSGVRLDASYSARDPNATGKSLAELREGPRITVTAPPLVLAAARSGSPSPGGVPMLALAVSEPMRGKEALLTVLARPLPASAVERVESEELQVPAGARLAFGYAVEEPGWSTGWPPVRVRVSAGDVTLFERRLDPVADVRDRRWFDASVDLSPVAGKRTRLVFEAEALAVPGAAVERSFVVVSNPQVLAPPAPTARRNVILVSLDTLRARSVGAYGCPRETTPTLDRRVADAGALVRTAVVPFPFTPPSHMTMLTGLEPCAHGVTDLHHALAPERTTLAEALRAAGYQTAAFTEDAYLVAGNGFDRGFDIYRENRSEESASPGFAAETFADASAWLAAHGARPFFLFVHTYQVHDPYTPPRGYAGLFPDVNASDQHDRARADYEREIRYTDDLFAGFLDALETHGLADDTIVVVTSDHGEGFGEHFWTGHGFDLHDEALLVPLMLRAPGLIPAGRVVEEQVGLVDLAPTLLALLDVPAPDDIQGRSFARLLTDRGAPFEERPLASAGIPATESLRTRDTKYVKTRAGDLFYDLRADPLERTSRLNEDPAGVAKARAALDEAHEACERWRAAHPASPEAEAEAGNAPAWMINRDEVERKLRSLGYVQ
jgi:arylsulfatase A-like enzyme